MAIDYEALGKRISNARKQVGITQEAFLSSADTPVHKLFEEECLFPKPHDFSHNPVSDGTAFP